MSIHRAGHEQFSLILAAPLVRRLLAGLYDEPVLTIMASNTLHAIIAHRSNVRCLTVEVGCGKVGDALDMAEGRSRVPFEVGHIDGKAQQRRGESHVQAIERRLRAHLREVRSRVERLTLPPSTLTASPSVS
jgi:metal-dependent HD superfamily phosphatase/phosphodiesterase